MDQYIFEKYKIDSITYRENQRYYAADARKYKKIYKKVIERFEKENPANTQNINNETSVGGYNNSVE
jgi:hypothetical protein